ncbi:MAG: MobP2 family relaxase [Clostridium sp.]
MPGIVHARRWVSSKDNRYYSYIDYIDRDEATRNFKFEDFSLYNDYMGNSKKSGSLFTDDKDFLTEKEVKELKGLFAEAQKNKSYMWQDVFSFENEWLEEQGLYDRKTNRVDTKKIMEAVRNSMRDMIGNENFETLIWSASLHYNTNHIHVHVASVELNPTRYTYESGFMQYKNLYKMKSKFANTLIDRDKEHKAINDIMRESIIQNKKTTHIYKDIEIKKMVSEIIKKLPEDKRQWHYNYNSLSEVRPMLDMLTRYYINNYRQKEFEELEKCLDEESEFLKNVYGEGQKFFYKNYKKNKIDELYMRMGNTLLKEIKKDIDTQKEKKDFKNNSHNIILTKKDIRRLKKIFDKEFDQIKNEMAYERLRNEIEYSY